jgi:hypothetical protein
MVKVLNIFNNNLRSRDNSVYILTGYGAGRPKGRSLSLGRVKIFSLSTFSGPVLGLPSVLYNGVKWPGREVDNLPTSAEVNTLSYTSTPPYVFTVCGA